MADASVATLGSLNADLPPKKPVQSVISMAHLENESQPNRSVGEDDEIVLPADYEQLVAEQSSSPRENTHSLILGETALHGLAGRIVRKLEPETEAHPAAMLVEIVMNFGSIIGRTAYYEPISASTSSIPNHRHQDCRLEPANIAFEMEEGTCTGNSASRHHIFKWHRSTQLRFLLRDARTQGEIGPVSTCVAVAFRRWRLRSFRREREPHGRNTQHHARNERRRTTVRGRCRYPHAHQGAVPDRSEG